MNARSHEVGFKPRFWTTGEDRLMREGYPQVGPQGCLERLPGRSLAALYNRAAILKLKAPESCHPGRRTKRKIWFTTEHIDAEITRTYYDQPTNASLRALTQRLGRPRWWVKKRAAQLGLSVWGVKEPEWTEEELEVLREAPHLGLEALQRRLKRAGFHRTPTAVGVKLKRLGLSRVDPNQYSARQLAGLMGLEVHVVMRWIERGGLLAQRRGTKRTPQQGGDEWAISRRAVRQFIIKNAPTVNLCRCDKRWVIPLLAGLPGG